MPQKAETNFQSPVAALTPKIAPHFSSKRQHVSSNVGASPGLSVGNLDLLESIKVALEDTSDSSQSQRLQHCTSADETQMSQSQPCEPNFVIHGRSPLPQASQSKVSKSYRAQMTSSRSYCSMPTLQEAQRNGPQLIIVRSSRHQNIFFKCAKITGLPIAISNVLL